MLAGNKREKVLESILALENSFEGSYYDTKLTGEESKKNIKDNIVKIYLHKSWEKDQNKHHFYMHYGLLLTTDGFILTNYRHVSEVLEEWGRMKPKTFFGRLFYESNVLGKYYAKASDGFYPLDVTVCSALPKYDIAILKAMVKKKAEPVKFKVDLKEPEIGEKVMILGGSNQNGMIDYEGTVTRDKGVMVNIAGKTVEGVFTIDSKYHLDKGGEPVLTPDGKFVGIGIGSTLREVQGHPVKNTAAAKVKRIDLCIRELTKRLYEEHHLHRNL